MASEAKMNPYVYGDTSGTGKYGLVLLLNHWVLYNTAMGRESWEYPKANVQIGHVKTNFAARRLEPIAQNKFCRLLLLAFMHAFVVWQVTIHLCEQLSSSIHWQRLFVSIQRWWVHVIGSLLFAVDDELNQSTWLHAWCALDTLCSCVFTIHTIYRKNINQEGFQLQG